MSPENNSFLQKKTSNMAVQEILTNCKKIRKDCKEFVCNILPDPNA